jgi:hypothetical protein
VAPFKIDKAFPAMLRIDPRAEHSGGQRFQHCLDPRIIEFSIRRQTGKPLFGS